MMMSAKSFFLACTALTAAIATAVPAVADNTPKPFAIAQAPRADVKLSPEQIEALKKQRDEKMKKDKAAPPAPAAKATPAAPPAAKSAAPAAAKPAEAEPVAKPPAPAAKTTPATPPPSAAQAKPAATPAKDDNKRDSKRDSMRDGRDRRDAQDRKPDQRPDRNADRKPATKPAPAAQKPAAPAPATAESKSDPKTDPKSDSKSDSKSAAQPAAKADTSQAAKPTARSAEPQPAVPAAAAPPPPTKAQNSADFIQRNGEKPSGGLREIRKQRRTTRDGNRTVIREGNRTIVRDGDRARIHHNEGDRFAVGARDVRVDKRGDQTISLVVRPNGISIVSTTDRDGRLLRRVRRGRDGREVVIIDNNFAGARRGDYHVDLRSPRHRGPRDRYILDAGRADREGIYRILRAPPIERIERRYTLDQVRYNEPLREYMPRVDLDVNFATGSWQLSPSQVRELSVIAQGINQAIDSNPREVFMVEGHTDAVGSEDDNLSLSDRRAESVAVALTEEFDVPPENLVTQGYGEEYPKVDTGGASRENRRVAVRRITPLIDEVATR